MSTPFSERALQQADGYYTSMFPKAPEKNEPVHASACRRMERALLSTLQTIEVLKTRLREMPDLVLENEKKNPAWSKAEIWGIERDIVPSIRALCRSAEFAVEDIWVCEACGIYFAESDSPGVEVSPDCEERITCCLECYLNAVDDPHIVKPYSSNTGC